MMELEVQMGISIPVFGVLSGALTGGPDGAGGGIGGNLGGFNGSYPFNTITNAIYNFTGGLTNPTTPITNIINNFTGGTNPTQTLTNIVSGLTDVNGNPTETITTVINSFTGGNNPAVETIQGGIDQLQELESFKTEIINSGINTLANTAIDTIHQSESPIADGASLGTLTFETSRDTVNGSLETVSDLAGADFDGAMDSATGVIDTLITNGSTETEIVQHIGEDLGNLGDLADGSPLEMITETVSEFTNTDESLSTITDLLGSITGDLNGGALGEITNLTETISGSLNGDSLDPITGAIDGFCSDIGFDLNSESIILGVSEPTQTIISSGNSVIDSVQESSTAIFSDSTFESISSLISLSVESGDDCGCDGGVDSILTAITGSTSTLTSVTEQVLQLHH